MYSYLTTYSIKLCTEQVLIELDISAIEKYVIIIIIIHASLPVQSNGKSRGLETNGSLLIVVCPLQPSSSVNPGCPGPESSVPVSSRLTCPISSLG